MNERDFCVHILDHEIIISKERVEYSKLRKTFTEYANDAANSFEKWYKSNSTLKGVAVDSPKKVMEIIRPALEECISVLVTHKVYSYDADSFFSKYVAPIEQWSTPYEALIPKFTALIQNEQAEKQIVDMKDAARGHWQGGGFGLVGALKGAATAGILNGISDAGAFIGTSIQKSRISSATDRAIRQIISNPQTLDSLKQGVYQTVFLMQLGIARCIKEHTGDGRLETQFIPPESEHMAQTILRNLYRITKESDRKEALIDSFKKNPYDPEWYRTVYNAYKDPDGELDRLAQLCNISVLDTYKASDYQSYCSILPLNSREAAVSSKKKAAEYAAQIHYSGIQSFNAVAEKAIQKIDIEARTVNGVLFNTPEEAEFNQREYDAICKDMVELGITSEDILKSDLAKARALEKRLRQYQGYFAHKMLEWLPDLIKELEKQAKTVTLPVHGTNGILLSSQKAAKEAQSYVDEIFALLKERPKPPYAEIAFLLQIEGRCQKDLQTAKYPTVVEAVIGEIQRQCKKVQETMDNYRAEANTQYSKMQDTNKRRVYIETRLQNDEKVIANARRNYMDKLGYNPDEIPLMVFDNAVMNRGEKGFVLTNRGLYSSGRSNKSKPHFIPFLDLQTSSFEVKGTELIINGNYSDLLQSSWLTRERIVKILKNYLLAVAPYAPRERTQVLHQQGTPPKETPSTNIPPKMADSTPKKIQLRILGNYQEYYALYNTADHSASQELTESIANGTVYNYYEIGCYLDNWLNSFDESELLHISSAQSKKYKNTMQFRSGAYDTYVKSSGFSRYEFFMLICSETFDPSMGFALSSRGIYINTSTSGGYRFYPIEEGIAVEYLPSTMDLKINDTLMDISFLSDNSKKILLEVLPRMIQMVQTVNQYFSKTLGNLLKSGEISQKEYDDRMQAITGNRASYSAPVQRKFCPQCGKPTSGKAKFCSQCGHQFL